MANKTFNTIENISSAVKTELDVRKSDRLRFKNQTPFANAISGLQLNGTSKSLSMKNLNIKSDVYDISTSYDVNIFRPKPNLMKVTSEYKNKFGSVKKTTIEWYCPNLKTLEELSPYFMTLGNTVYVEWGWTDGSIHSFYNNNDFYNIVNIKSKVSEKNSALFDATIGIITNYSYSLNDDESFTCTTELTSIANTMESILSSGNIISPNVINGNNNDIFLTFRTYLNSGAFYNEIYNYATDIIPNDPEYNKKNPDHWIIFASSDQITQMINSYKGNTTKSFSYEFDSTKNPLYISWGFIEDIILGNNYNIYTEINGIKNKITALTSKGNKVNYYDYVRSTDLEVCIFPIINKGKILKSDGKDDENFLKYPNETFNLKNYEQSFSGEIRKILVHTEFFRKTMNSSPNIMDGIKKILSHISDVCGGYFEFILSQIENNGMSWEVISLNQLNNSDYSINNLYEFNISDGKSNIINASSKTTMSNIAALNVFYNAQASDDIIHGGDLEENLYSIFKYDSNEYVDDYGFQNKVSTIVKNDNQSAIEKSQLSIVMENSKKMIINKHEKFGYKYLKRYLPVSDYGYNYKIHDNTDETQKDKDSNIQLDGEEGMKYGISSYIKDTFEINNVLSSIVPIDNTIELDGIAGFNITDSFTANFIHSKFKDRGVFQIVGITDNISRDEWKTQLKVNFRVMNKINTNLYRYVKYNDDGDAFWKKVKEDKNIQHKIEKTKKKDKQKQSYQSSMSFNIGKYTWSMPVDPEIGGIYTLYGDDFVGYRARTKVDEFTSGHLANDIATSYSGDDINIYACLDGIVVGGGVSANYIPQPTSYSTTSAGHNDGAGNFVMIRTDNLILSYLHFKSLEPDIKFGAEIKRGIILGKMGNTGDSRSRHLHLHIRYYDSIEAAINSNKNTSIRLNPYAFLYKGLTNNNKYSYKYYTAFAFNPPTWINTLHISDISDYENLYSGNLFNDKSKKLPNTKNLLILIGGWSSELQSVQSWGNALISHLGSDSWGLVAKGYSSNYNSAYDKDYLQMSNVAKELELNPTKYENIYVIGHSSGAFASFWLINSITNNTIKNKISLFVLDQNDGDAIGKKSVNFEESNNNMAKLSITKRVGLKAIKAISVKNGAYKSKYYDQNKESFGNNFIDITNYTSKVDKVLHSGMVVNILFNDGKSDRNGYYINQNYNKLARGSEYIVSWLNKP